RPDGPTSPSRLLGQTGHHRPHPARLRRRGLAHRPARLRSALPRDDPADDARPRPRLPPAAVPPPRPLDPRPDARDRAGSAHVARGDRGPPMILGFIPRGRHLLAYDVVTTGIAIAIAFAMRFDVNNIAATMAPYLPAALLPLLTYPPTYVAFGLYRREWRYASVREMFGIAAAVAVGTGITIAVFLVLAVLNVPGTDGFPRSVFFIQALLNLAFLGGGRFL